MTKGTVVRAFGNLVHVAFEGSLRQGEVARIHVEGVALKGEVIEILGGEAKVQIFEDTHGIAYGAPVDFEDILLEAELGPGLLTSIVDGLQNPLEKIGERAGFFLQRGLYIAPLDREKIWCFYPCAKVGDRVCRGDILGHVEEGHFNHFIMVPFALWETYTLTYIAPEGGYSIDKVIAKGVDNEGVEHVFTMVQRWPIKQPLIEGERILPQEMMVTGLRIIDTQFPILKGGTFCTPGPFGAGKTVLQHHLSKYSSVDMVVLTACGERAGEVVEVLKEFPLLTDAHTGKSLMERTVIICNTSSMPVAARESSIYLGITIAEYYRQMGLHVLLLADSTSRWAQALREISGRLEEIPGEEAFPAYLASRITEFYERAGALSLKHGKVGSLTLCGAVSPAGGNFEEPVTQATLAVVGAFLGLSRERSDARRYPSVDPLISWSKYGEKVGHILDAKVGGWDKKVMRALAVLEQGGEVGRRMEVIGEEGTAMDDFIIYLKAELYDFCYLQQNAFDKEDAFCSLEKQLALFSLVDHIFGVRFHFSTHDEARTFFLQMQSHLKNMNFMPFPSEEYRHAEKIFYDKVEEVCR